MAQLAIVENTSPEPQADFDTFWLLYPRKEARKDTLKAWGQMDPAHAVPAIEALVGWRREWARREAQYIPLAASWLRGERYFDELPRGVTVTAAAHQAFGPSEKPAPKGELPDHVKAMIAKLKGRS